MTINTTVSLHVDKKKLKKDKRCFTEFTAGQRTSELYAGNFSVFSCLLQPEYQVAFTVGPGAMKVKISGHVVFIKTNNRKA